MKDYWIVNLVDLRIEIHRKPRRGAYKEIEALEIGQSISPLAFPSASLDVSYVFAQ